MKYDKRIITHQWGNNPTHDEFTSSNGFIISAGTYARSMDFLNELAAEAKRDFPAIKDSDIEPFVITKSSHNQGFAGIRFPLPDDAGKAGYRQASSLDFVHSY